MDDETKKLLKNWLETTLKSNKSCDKATNDETDHDDPESDEMEASKEVMVSTEIKAQVEAKDHFHFEAVKQQIGALEEELQKVKETVHEDHSMLEQMEIEACETKVLIKNVPLYKNLKKKKESPDQTMSVVQDLLESTKTTLTINAVSEWYRMYHKPPVKKHPTLCIEFTSKHELHLFIKSLAKLKKIPRYENVQSDMYIPPTLRKDYHLASEAAFKIRSETKAETKIRTIKGKIELFSRTSRKKPFEKTNFLQPQ